MTAVYVRKLITPGTRTGFLLISPSGSYLWKRMPVIIFFSISIMLINHIVMCSLSVFSLLIFFPSSCQSSGYEVYILEAPYKDPAVSIICWYYILFSSLCHNKGIQ